MYNGIQTLKWFDIYGVNGRCDRSIGQGAGGNLNTIIKRLWFTIIPLLTLIGNLHHALFSGNQCVLGYTVLKRVIDVDKWKCQCKERQAL